MTFVQMGATVLAVYFAVVSLINLMGACEFKAVGELLGPEKAKEVIDRRKVMSALCAVICALLAGVATVS